MGLKLRPLFLTFSVLLTGAATLCIGQDRYLDESAPVEVAGFQVKDVGYELRLTDADLKGHSAKPVKAVEFTWYVVQKEGGSTIIIKEGLPTTWMALPEQLREGGELKLRHTGITIRKV